MKKLLIFDFDGTLVDTLTDVALCFNEALEIHGYPQHSLDAFGGFVGGNLETVVSRMLPLDVCTTQAVDRVKNTYRRIYLESPKENSTPYPGMMALLEHCRARGCLLAVNSNKGQALLDAMVEKLFPKGAFDAVVGYQEAFPSKPDPYGVRCIMERCGCSPENAVYIGDGLSDVKTAQNAGIPCVFVTWGQGYLDDPGAFEHVVEADSTDALERLLFSDDI